MSFSYKDAKIYLERAQPHPTTVDTFDTSTLPSELGLYCCPKWLRCQPNFWYASQIQKDYSTKEDVFDS